MAHRATTAHRAGPGTGLIHHRPWPAVPPVSAPDQAGRSHLGLGWGVHPPHQRGGLRSLPNHRIPLQTPHQNRPAPAGAANAPAWPATRPQEPWPDPAGPHSAAYSQPGPGETSTQPPWPHEPGRHQPAAPTPAVKGWCCPPPRRGQRTRPPQSGASAVAADAGHGGNEPCSPRQIRHPASAGRTSSSPTPASRQAPRPPAHLHHRSQRTTATLRDKQHSRAVQ